ncbi:tetratricopeptide repeat protein [Aequorivita marina]|uniref:tetratricopeptide repeat protein n=1 Tax=Aequorivita marina TaxID=3073654 RepID=UPI0028762AE4|nr:tetratricopeptide repeat protein [Aequorivita sp. S2608]MDS1296845.1 tetratricopeptide repeat protein [Aequorivita sp. S2608]
MKWHLKFKISRMAVGAFVSILLIVIVFILIRFIGAPNKLFTKGNKTNETSTKIGLLLDSAHVVLNHNPTKAKELIKEGNALVIKNGVDSLLPKIHYAQGELAIQQSNYPKALQHFLDAKRTLEENPSKNENTQIAYAQTLNQLSRVYFSLERTDKALEYLQHSLSIYKSMNRKEDVANTLRNMGGIYFKEQKFEKALDAYERVLEYYEKTGKQEGIQVLYSNLGAVNLILERPDKSIVYLNKAEEKIRDSFAINTKSQKLSKELSKVLYNKACYFYEVNETDLYSEYLIKSIKALDTFYAPAEAHDPLLNLHEVYYKDAAYEKAYKTLLKFQEVRDTLYNIESNKQIAELEVQHELFREQQAYEREKRKTERQYWMALAGLMLILLLVLTFLNRQKVKIINAEEERKRLAENKKQLESHIDTQKEVLSQKEGEVRRLASQIVEKNENILSLEEQMEQINTSARKHLNQQKINDLIKNTRESQDLETDRKQLLLSLEQSSALMFEKLDSDYKGLTDRQKHLAALVKYGFTAKEISVLFNISHKSVQTAKYRLKKVLKLPSSQDLEVFLKAY